MKPVHEGEYELQPSSGAVVRADFRDRKWQADIATVTHWRGLRLKGIEKTRARRRTLDAYRSAKTDTHTPALNSALFLARRAVSLNFGPDAYRFYLVAK